MKLVNQIDNILSSTFISALSLSYLIDSPPTRFFDTKLAVCYVFYSTAFSFCHFVNPKIQGGGFTYIRSMVVTLKNCGIISYVDRCACL